jgi:hypothetical protein
LLIMLTLPVYMLQVYDRVLTTGRVRSTVPPGHPQEASSPYAEHRRAVDAGWRLRIAGAGSGFKPLPATTDWRRFYRTVTQGGPGK